MKRASLTKEALTRALRMYNNSNDIAKALGVTYSSVTRACRRLGLECPKDNHGITKTSGGSYPKSKPNLGLAQLEADKVLALVAQDKEKREKNAKNRRRRNRNS